MFTSRISLTCILTVACTNVTFAEDKIDTAFAVERAKAVAKAVLENDFEKVADSTHPKVVEIMGGREKMIAASKSFMQTLKSQGITIQSNVTGKPHEPVIDGGSAYIIIPTTMVLKTEDAKITTESYLLGLSTDGGKKWVFVDGSGMDQPKVKEIVFPKFPAALKLPEKKEPTITKD